LKQDDGKNDSDDERSRCGNDGLSLIPDLHFEPFNSSTVEPFLVYSGEEEGFKGGKAQGLKEALTLRFEWNDTEVSEEQRAEIQEFLARVNELGLENAFFDEEALVYMDGTHVPIPACVRVIRD